MNTFLLRFWGTLKTGLLILLVEFMVAQPLAVVWLSTNVQAADTTTSTAQTQINDQACLDIARASAEGEGEGETEDSTEVGDILPDELDEDVTPSATTVIQSINLAEIRASEAPLLYRNKVLSQEYIRSVFEYYGGRGMAHYASPITDNSSSSPEEEWIYVCNNASTTIDPLMFDAFAPIPPEAFATADILLDPNPYIGFSNEGDKYALLGEVCQGGLITDPPYAEWDENTKPCPGFQLSDDKNGNGEWDAPKVDRRVIDTALYLVTPANQGGAGREFIRIKKLVQSNKTDEFPQVVQTEEDTAEDEPIVTDPEDDTEEPTNTSTTDTYEALASSYWVDPSDPPHQPKKVSAAMMIDQIDRFRTTTKITYKRFFRNNSTEYKVNVPQPVDVAWQSDEGMGKDSPPDVTKPSILESSRMLINQAVIEMLNQYGLGDLELDVTKMEVNDFGDVALVVGQSLLETLLGTPKNSLQGWSLTTVLKNIGLAYSEQTLGLAPGSLADTSILDRTDESARFEDLTRDIGRATVEYVLGFPSRSLATTDGTSNSILESLGRNYLEQSIFKVSSGSMTGTPDYPIATVGDLLERLGEGRIETVLKLPRQSLRVKTYEEFRKSNLKMKLAFPEIKGDGVFTNDDYAMADYVSNRLGLAYIPYKYKVGDKTINSGTSMYGFSENDFTIPSLQINPGDPGSLAKFKQIVGSRVIESSIGLFKRSGSERVDREIDPTLVPVKELSLGGHVVNAQFRPVDDGTEYEAGKKGQGAKVNGQERSGNWCGQAELRYVLSRNGNGEEDSWRLSNDTTDAEIKDKIIPNLMNRHGSDSFGYTAMNHQCSNSGAIDPYLTGRLQDILFTGTPVERTVFLNQENAPKYADLETENNGGSYHENQDELDGRFNTALILYYNLKENHSVTPINTVYTGSAKTESGQTDSGTPVTPEPVQTVSQILDKLINGSPATGDGFDGWKADPSLKNRYEMMRSALNSATSSNLYSINDLAGLPSDQLDNEVIKRLNTLTAHPVADPQKKDPYQFKKQYNDPKYNGWSYMLEDLKARLQCKQENKYYRFNGDDSKGDNDYSYNATAMGCYAQSAEIDKPDIKSRTEVESAGKRIEDLAAAPAAIATRLINILTTGAIEESLSIEGISSADLRAEIDANRQEAEEAAKSQSAQSVGVNLFSNLPTIDANGRYLTAEECAASQAGCFYSRDIIRTLTSPGPPGPVNRNASISAFFDRGSAARTKTASNANRSMLGEIGRQVAAQHFSSDKLAQVTFAAQLDTDFGKEIESGADILETLERADLEAKDSYGIPSQALQDKGLAGGDFARLFQLDLADQVFERIGKEELLRTVWKISGASARIKNSEQLQSILRQGRTFARTYEFYRERFDKVRTLTSQLNNRLDDLGESYSRALDQLRSLNSKPLTSASAAEIRQLARAYEPVLNNLRKNARGTEKSLEDIEKLAYQIDHLTQEIAAGRTLPHDERFNGESLTDNGSLVGKRTSTAVIDRNDCITPQLIISTLQSQGDFNSKFTEFAHQVGGCKIDASFGLARGASMTWYLLNKHGYTYTERLIEKSKETGLFVMGPENTIVSWENGSWDTESMRIAFALASRVSKGKLGGDVLDDPFEYILHISADATKELVAEGDKIVQALILSKIVSLIPGIGNVKKVGLNADDFVQIMQGNLKPLAEKVGGRVLDKALGLDQGTTYELLHPTCRDNNDQPAPCSKRPDQPGTDPDFIRTQLLAQIGLKKLGITIPLFPKNFDLRAGGNMMVNWGNAVLTDELNLAPNSFRGSLANRPPSNAAITDPQCIANPFRCFNAEWTLMQAFGIPYSPMLQNLDAIRKKMDCDI